VWWLLHDDDAQMKSNRAKASKASIREPTGFFNKFRYKFQRLWRWWRPIRGDGGNGYGDWWGEAIITQEQERWWGSA